MIKIIYEQLFGFLKENRELQGSDQMIFYMQ